MAQTFRYLSSLLIVVACCFLNGATAEEREGKQILLPAVPPYPFYFYANSPVAPVYVNGGETPVEMDARVQSSDAVGRTFFRIFGCPTCPTCPAPCPTCTTCAVCPATPSIPAKAITLSPAAADCLTNAILTAAGTISACSSVTAAPKGTIDVTFAAAQTVSIGIAAVSPNTQIKLTCTDLPATDSKTQNGVLVANTPVTILGYIQIIASGVAGNRFKCSWESS